MKPIDANDTVGPLQLNAIDGRSIVLPGQRGRLTHLQFRRFAGCPICNLHMRSLQLRADEIEGAGIDEVIVFYSTEKSMRSLLAEYRFAAFVADPDRVLYRKFGVGRSLGAILSLKAAWSGLNGLLRNLKRAHRMAPLGEDVLGLPADFLIDSEGTVVACKRGVNGYDQWSVDELLAIARDCSGKAAANPA